MQKPLILFLVGEKVELFTELFQQEMSTKEILTGIPTITKQQNALDGSLSCWISSAGISLETLSWSKEMDAVKKAQDMTKTDVVLITQFTEWKKERDTIWSHTPMQGLVLLKDNPTEDELKDCDMWDEVISTETREAAVIPVRRLAGKVQNVLNFIH